MRYRYTDQEEGDALTEILQRLDRLEQALVVLAQRDDGDNGDGELAPDQQMGGSNVRPDPSQPRPTTPQPKQMGDTLVERGNLSKVDPDVYDPGTVYPDDKSSMGTRRTNDTFQTFRDRFLSRNPINPNVVSINAANRRRYG
jgi:hypothetical protein